MKSRLPSNWRSRIEIVEVEENISQNNILFNFKYNIHIFTLQFRKGCTPKGYRRLIGQCTISTQQATILTLEINHRFQRRRLGTMLLEKALNHFGTLSISWGHASEQGKHFYKWFSKNIAVPGEWGSEFSELTFKRKINITS